VEDSEKGDVFRIGSERSVVVLDNESRRSASAGINLGMT
jgi:hypothetical protein